MKLYGGAERAPSGGGLRHLSGTGKLTPGKHDKVKVLFLEDWDSGMTIGLMALDKTAHYERIARLPALNVLKSGDVVSVVVGLSNGVIAVRDGLKWYLKDAVNKGVVFGPEQDVTVLHEYILANKLSLATPELKEIIVNGTIHTIKR